MSCHVAKRAEAIIDQQGLDMTIRKISAAYDPSTGAAAESNTDLSCRGIFKNVKDFNNNNTLKRGERIVSISANSLSQAPTADDDLIIDSVTYQIRSVKPVYAADTIILYEIIAGI